MRKNRSRLNNLSTSSENVHLELRGGGITSFSQVLMRLAEADDVEAQIARSHRLDDEDVRSGKISPESLRFIPKSIAQNAKLRHPPVYRKSW